MQAKHEMAALEAKAALLAASNDWESKLEAEQQAAALAQDEMRGARTETEATHEERVAAMKEEAAETKPGFVPVSNSGDGAAERRPERRPANLSIEIPPNALKGEAIRGVLPSDAEDGGGDERAPSAAAAGTKRTRSASLSEPVSGGRSTRSRRGGE